MNPLKVKRHRKSDTKTGNREPQQNTALERSVMIYCRGGGLKHVLRRQPGPQFMHIVFLAFSFYSASAGILLIDNQGCVTRVMVL